MSARQLYTCRGRLAALVQHSRVGGVLICGYTSVPKTNYRIAAAGEREPAGCGLAGPAAAVGSGARFGVRPAHVAVLNARDRVTRPASVGGADGGEDHRTRAVVFRFQKHIKEKQNEAAAESHLLWGDVR